MNPNPAGNAFLDLCIDAFENNRCTKPFCTTCGGQSFRTGLKARGLDDPEQLASAMADAGLSELMLVPKWDECITLCFTLLVGKARERVLEVWLDKLDSCVRVADLVLFRLLPEPPAANRLADRWTARCIQLAIETADESLIESLLIVRPEQVIGHGALLPAANEVAGRSKKVAKLLRKLKS